MTRHETALGWGLPLSLSIVLTVASAATARAQVCPGPYDPDDTDLVSERDQPYLIHLVDADRNLLVVVGGSLEQPHGGHGPAGDVVALDLDTDTWFVPQIDGPEPAIATIHSTAYDSSRNRAVVVEYDWDTYVLDLEPAGTLADPWVWSEIEVLPASEGERGSRPIGGGATYDAVDDRVLFFGDQYNGDRVWQLQFTDDDTACVVLPVFSSTTLHVDSVSYADVGPKGRDLEIEVAVSELGGPPAAGVTVSGSLYRDGGFLEYFDAVTESDGLATYLLRRPQSGCYTTEVYNVYISYENVTWDGLNPANGPYCR